MEIEVLEEEEEQGNFDSCSCVLNNLKTKADRQMLDSSMYEGLGVSCIAVKSQFS